MFVYVGTAILNTEMLRICKKKIFAYFQRNVGLFYGHLLASTNTPPPLQNLWLRPCPAHSRLLEEGDEQTHTTHRHTQPASFSCLSSNRNGAINPKEKFSISRMKMTTVGIYSQPAAIIPLFMTTGSLSLTTGPFWRRYTQQVGCQEEGDDGGL